MGRLKLPIIISCLILLLFAFGQTRDTVYILPGKGLIINGGSIFINKTTIEKLEGSGETKVKQIRLTVKAKTPQSQPTRRPRYERSTQ
jgi:hypothetical protein